MFQNCTSPTVFKLKLFDWVLCRCVIMKTGKAEPEVNLNTVRKGFFCLKRKKKYGPTRSDSHCY